MNLVNIIDNRLLELQTEMVKLQTLKELEQNKQLSLAEVSLLKLSEKQQQELESLNSTLRSNVQMEVIVNHILGTLQLVQYYSDIPYTIAVYSESEVRGRVERLLGTANTTHPISYWLQHISGLVGAFQVLFELTGGNFYEIDLKYDFTKSLLTFNFNQFRVVVTAISSLHIDSIEVSKEISGSCAKTFNLNSEGLVLGLFSSTSESITATITVPCKIYSNSKVITEINKAMEKIDNFLEAAKIPV